MLVIARLCRRKRDDKGFTLLELTVALFVILLVVAALGGILIGSLQTVSQSRQRQTASALANGTMEQLRSLDYTTLRNGNYCSDVLNTPYVSGSTCAALTLTLNGYNETIQTSGSSAAVQGLNPHVVSTTTDGVTYKTYAWVTANPTTTTAYNLTVLVSWTGKPGGGTKTIVQRSTAFSPSRCLSSATHPWAGPCQASFTGQAGLTAAEVAVTNATDATQPIAGFTATSMTLGLPALAVNGNIEQVSKLSGSASTTDATAVTAGTSSPTGGVPAAAAADNDPSSTGTSSSSSQSVAQSWSSNNITGTAGTISGAPVYSENAAVNAAVASSSTCVDVNGATMPSSGQPCSAGSVNSTSTTTGGAGALVYNPSGLLKTFTLAALSPSNSASAVTARILTSNGTLCPGTSGVGCQESQAKRTLGTLTLGGLPAASTGDSLPSNWNQSMITVTGLTETATAESGIRSGSPNAATYSRSGTVSYWNGTSTPATISLNALAADRSVNLAAASAVYKNGTHTYNVSISGKLTAGGYSASGSLSGATPCKTSACAASPSASSALTADLVYTVTYDGGLLTTFDVHVDLGAVLAQTSYLAAFDG